MEFHLLDLLLYLILCIPFYIWNKKQEPVSWEGGVPLFGWFMMSLAYIGLAWNYDVVDIFSYVTVSL